MQCPPILIPTSLSVLSCGVTRHFPSSTVLPDSHITFEFLILIKILPNSHARALTWPFDPRYLSRLKSSLTLKTHSRLTFFTLSKKTGVQKSCRSVSFSRQKQSTRQTWGCFIEHWGVRNQDLPKCNFNKSGLFFFGRSGSHSPLPAPPQMVERLGLFTGKFTYLFQGNLIQHGKCQQSYRRPASE